MLRREIYTSPAIYLFIVLCVCFCNNIFMQKVPDNILCGVLSGIYVLLFI